MMNLIFIMIFNNSCVTMFTINTILKLRFECSLNKKYNPNSIASVITTLNKN